MDIYNNEQDMMPCRRKNINTPRAMPSVKNNRFDSPFRSPYASPTLPYHAAISGPHSSFRYRPPYQHRKRPYCHPPSPIYPINSPANVQHSSNWLSPRTSSPYIYKSPQNMIQGYDFSATSPDSRFHSHKNPRTVCLAEQFDVNDYVIPAMTANPWSKLEEFHANCRMDEQ
ncbi:unnamed protein product [Litomosoides sigmodontis]|uniref:Uncharacterized protein n=1 Tax=Litomosoides sigmodontis TaxID=42156 RepID=A0A3P6UQL1_LITSI|nr:unnamed protein product [Litomosoides sigmodontis]